ncbi:MAG: menaquinol-cytochrome c reductase cytochrome b subunit [Actinomycetota bacterium]
MADRAETPMDDEVYERVLKEQTEKGADKRVAEGKARSAAVLAYRKVHGEPEKAPKAAPAAAAGGNGGAAQPAAAATQAAPAAMAAAPMLSAPAAAVRIAPPPTGTPPTAAKPGQAEKHRLLALVPPEGIQRVEREQGDRVNVWPHLLIEEFVALLVVSAFLLVFSTFVNAPLLELANPNLTPNPSKAPWYFMGLQELLRYFHPTIAGVMMPTVCIIALIVLPYFDRNPSTKPGDRKIAVTLFTMFIMFWAILVMIGSFFRGPAQNWVWPWTQGLFFDL